MSTRLLTKRAQIFVAPEEDGMGDSVEGVYVPPLGTGVGMINGMVGDNPLSLESSNMRPTYVRPDMINQSELVGKVSASISFSFWLHGSGALVVPTLPDYSEALKAAGFALSPIATGPITYFLNPVFDGAAGPPVNPQNSYSCTILEDGAAYAIRNACVSAMTFNAVTGEPTRVDVTMMGALVAPADDGLEAVTAYNPANPPSFLGAAFAVDFSGALSPRGLDAFTIDLGITAAALTDVNEPEGISGARITNYDLSGSFTMEAELIANNAEANMIQKWRDMAADPNLQGTITTGAIGAAAAFRYTLNIAEATLRPPELVSQDGIRKYNIPFSFGIPANVAAAIGTCFDIVLD